MCGSEPSGLQGALRRLGASGGRRWHPGVCGPWGRAVAPRCVDPGQSRRLYLACALRCIQADIQPRRFLYDWSCRRLKRQRLASKCSNCHNSSGRQMH